MGRRRYLFSDKKNPPAGIISTVLGLISFVTVVGMLIGSYRHAGVVGPGYGAAALLSVIYAVIGLVMGIRSHMNPDMLLFFPKAGIVINSAAILLCALVMYAGM